MSTRTGKWKYSPWWRAETMPQTMPKQRHCEGRYMTRRGAWCGQALWTCAEAERFMAQRRRHREYAEIITEAGAEAARTPLPNLSLEPTTFGCYRSKVGSYDAPP